MAFYRDTEKKTRQQKRTLAESRGGFDDEGAHYGEGGARRGGDRPRGGRPASDRPGPGGRKPYGDKPAYGDRPRGGAGSGFGRPAPEGRKPYGDRPAKPYGDKPAYGDRPRGGAGGGFGRPAPEGRKPYGDRPAKPYGDKPSYGDRPRGGAGSGFGRPAPESRKPYGDRPAKPNFSDRSRGGEFRYQPKPERYSERGEGTAPRSYDEQRREKAFDRPRADERGYERYRYAAPASYAPPVDETEDIVPNENLLSGRNPIREALKSGRDIEKLMVQRGELSGSAREIIQMAKERHIPVQEVDRARLDAITQNHQGMLAFASAYQYGTLEQMLALAEERGEKPFLVLLDGVTDPHNLGAIIRTAECAGAHGVIVQERRAVGLTPAAVKASAGAVEYVPVARVTNLVSTIEALQKQNVWVFAADMQGEDYAQADFSGAVALVIGAEGEGVSRLVREKCDKTVSLPLKGKLDSLNASVAAGILLYAVMRAR